MRVKRNKQIFTMIIVFCIFVGMAFVLIYEGGMKRAESVLQFSGGDKQAYRVREDMIYDNVCIEDNYNTALLPDSLIIQQGCYQVDGDTYELSIGLNRIFDCAEGVQHQRIVVPETMIDQKDIDELISNICGVICHGTGDDGKDVQELENKALQDKLSLTCGYAASFVYFLLKKVNIESRIVAGLTLEEWNNYNNGHTMLEVYIPNTGWVLYDIDNNCYFSYKGKHLNLIDIYNCISNNLEYEINMISSDTRCDISTNKYGKPLIFFYEYLAWNQESLKNWYNRILQVILIMDDSGCYRFSDKENRERIESYSKAYKYIEGEDFKNFYK